MWLESLCFFAGLSTGKCAMLFLDLYLSGDMIELATSPGEWTKGIRQKTLDRMLAVIGDDSKTAECIIVESSDEVTVLWGELLSRKSRGKLCVCCGK